jgi:hypothetical protein
VIGGGFASTALAVAHISALVAKVEGGETALPA